MKDEITFVMGTVIMVFLSVLFIFFVIWSSFSIVRLKKYLHDRDKHYLERITGMEDLIKKEFLEVIRSIKKL